MPWERGHRDIGYPDGDYPSDVYPGEDHSRAGRQDAGYRDADHQDAGYGDAGHQDAGYRDAGRQDAGYRDAGHWDAGRQDSGYRDAAYRDTGRQDAGYRDGGYRDAGRQDGGRRARRSSGYAERRDDDRGRWDDRRAPAEDGSAGWRGESRDSRARSSRGGRAGEASRSWDDHAPERWVGDDREAWAGDHREAWAADDREGWARDSQDWAGDHTDWAGDHEGWAGERGAWAGQDRRSWDVDVWGGEDEEPADDGYRRGHRRDATGGAEGNERLTALTGTVLLVLFAAEGFTILSVHRLLTLHFFLGMLLVGPVALKACAVLYRFVRYYTGAGEYRRKGPPAPLLRVLGPVVLITSLAVIGTGIMLAVTGPSGLGTWLFLHRASFVLWFGAMTVHVLTYVWRLPRLVTGDLASRAGQRAHEVLAGRPARWLLLTASILTGLLLALLTVHRTGLWFVGH